MKIFLISFGFISCLFVSLKGVSIDEFEGAQVEPLPKIDEAAFLKYKTQVCESVPSFKGDGAASKPNPWSDEISEGEIFELAFLNMAYGLTGDAISHLQEDMGYKKRVLDLIELVTKQSCNNDVVPEMYLNVAKNLFLYYIFKKEKGSNSTKIPGPLTPSGRVKPTSYVGTPAPKGNGSKPVVLSKEETWLEIVSMLEQCAENVHPIAITQTCDIADHLVLPSGELMDIIYAEERLDLEKHREGYEFVDEVIDAVWWMFSTTYARCYTMYYPREDWVVQFFENFRVDFLNQFLNRWRNPGPLAEYFPIIYGPFDFRRAKLNLRACNGAAYQYEEISERQLVRPVMVTVDGVKMLNFKTGVPLGK